jgi:hypothetical protein
MSNKKAKCPLLPGCHYVEMRALLTKQYRIIQDLKVLRSTDREIDIQNAKFANIKSERDRATADCEIALETAGVDTSICNAFLPRTHTDFGL